MFFNCLSLQWNNFWREFWCDFFFHVALQKKERVVLSYQLNNDLIILQRFVFRPISRSKKFLRCIFTRIYSNIYYILIVFFNLFQRKVSFSVEKLRIIRNIHFVFSFKKFQNCRERKIKRKGMYNFTGLHIGLRKVTSFYSILSLTSENSKLGFLYYIFNLIIN